MPYHVNNAPSQVLVAASFKDFFFFLWRTYFHYLVFLLEGFLQCCIRMETADIYHTQESVKNFSPPEQGLKFQRK